MCTGCVCHGGELQKDLASCKKTCLNGCITHAGLVPQRSKAEAEVIPTASALVIRALKEPVRDRKKEKNSTLCGHGSSGPQRWVIVWSAVPLLLSSCL